MQPNSRSHALGNATTALTHGQATSQDRSVGKQDKETHGCCIWNYYCHKSHNGTANVDRERARQRQRQREWFVEQSVEVYLTPGHSIHVNNRLGTRHGPGWTSGAHASTLHFN